MKPSLFADADHADIFNNRRSVWVVLRSCSEIQLSASSMTQHCVTLSTGGAENDAIAHGTKTVLAINAVLYFVHPHLSGRAIDVFQDNEGA